MRFLCRIGWHEWEKWHSEIMTVIPNFYGVAFPENSYKVTVEVTNCKHCNKRKIKE